MQIQVVYQIFKSSLRQLDSFQLLMLSLALLDALILMSVLISDTPGIQVLWFIPTSGILLCLVAAMLGPFSDYL